MIWTWNIGVFNGVLVGLLGQFRRNQWKFSGGFGHAYLGVFRYHGIISQGIWDNDTNNLVSASGAGGKSRGVNE